MNGKLIFNLGFYSRNMIQSFLYLNFDTSHIRAWISKMPNLQWWGWNITFPKGLVNKSTTWRQEGVKVVCTSSNWILSLTRWQSYSICFVHSWKTGFVAMCMVTQLSQCIFATPKLVTCISWRSYLNQVNSQVMEAMAL